MPAGTGSAMLAVGIVIVVSIAVVLVVVPMIVRRTWGRWVPAFVPQPHEDGAVTRRYQSFNVGLLNLGHGVHVTVDSRFLHLRPSMFTSVFGIRPVSIPWEAIRVDGTFPFKRRNAMIAGVPLIGPAWCLEMAEAATAAQA